MNRKTKKSVTSYDVAKLAGVSQSAVSRAFAKGKSISKDKRQRIEKAAKELGYRVNYTAQSLSSPRSRLVGVVVSRLEHPVRARQTRIITENLIEEGYHPILLCTDDTDMSDSVLDDLLGYNLSGIIVTSGHVPVKIIEECHSLDIPVVALYHDTNLAGVDHVGLDIEHAGKLAFDMLYSCGARKMAVVRIGEFSHTLSKRADHFIKMCNDNDVPCHTFDSTENSYELGKELSYNIYENIKNIDAIFCSNDVIAMGVMDGLKQFGIAIPNDIQILGFDDIPVAGWGGYELSTIRLRLEKPSIKAVDMLTERMEDPTKEYETYYAPLTSVFRKTTRSYQ